MQTNYTAITASAGSGKTYALVQKLLLICLRNPSQHGAIRNILALTFTNKAANEMKHRIIQWLRNFSGESYESNNELIQIQEKLKTQGTEVSLQELHKRAKKILDFVIHNYSALNIGTIDKFNAKLVRSFSYELGLAQNFNLEINPEPYLLEAVDKMLEDIGAENNISDAFMDFVHYNLDNNEKVNLNKTLYKAAKEYVQDKHYFHLEENKNFDWQQYEEIKEKLRSEIIQLKKNSAQIVANCQNLIIEKNLTISDFKGGAKNGLGLFFEKAAKYFNGDGEFPFPSNEENALATFTGGVSATGKHKQHELSEILDFLISSRQQIISNIIEESKKEKVLRAILPLKVNKDIQDKLSEIETENDLVLLNKFNVMIHENLRQEPSLFIYEKIGTQFDHYFFDEFQDTSTLQWQNIIPLRDHAVSLSDTSVTLVGDPKQSIYRFRGGDSQLMLDIINKKEKTPVYATLEPLENNWRSAKNIVKFNNELYQFLSAYTSGEHIQLFGEGAQQIAKSNIEGRVRINLFENTTSAIFFEEVAEQIAQDIQQCLDNGFTMADITILCRKNSEILLFSELLGKRKVNYQNTETYIKTISENGLTLGISSTIKALTEFLRWEQDPKNLQYPVKMLYYLQSYGQIKSVDFSAEMVEMLTHPQKEKIQEFILEKYGLNLHSGQVLQLNLYNTIEYFLQKLSKPDHETDFLFNYLELVYAYSQNSSSTLKDFLKFWDEEGKNTNIQASENLDAVKLMTVHKAKGLEFPVVMLPIRNTNKDSSFSNWWKTETENSCASVNISGFNAKLAAYDPQMQDFNQRNAYENKIDRFCLSYVASTRAVEQLFFYVEQESKSANQLELYEFLKPHIPKTSEGETLSFDFYEVDEQQLKKQKNEPKEELYTQKISFENKESKPENIRIATPSKSYQNRVEHVRIGILVHEILSKIKTKKDLSKTLNSYLLEGSITSEEKTEIENRILNIITNSENAKYFEENQIVIAEKDIMLSENGVSIIFRPDRLMKSDHGFIIIDFKTGAPNETHNEQLKQYQNVLEKLGNTVIETKVIYI